MKRPLRGSTAASWVWQCRITQLPVGLGPELGLGTRCCSWLDLHNFQLSTSLSGLTESQRRISAVGVQWRHLEEPPASPFRQSLVH